MKQQHGETHLWTGRIKSAPIRPPALPNQIAMVRYRWWAQLAGLLRRRAVDVLVAVEALQKKGNEQWNLPWILSVGVQLGALTDSLGVLSLQLLRLRARVPGAWLEPA